MSSWRKIQIKDIITTHFSGPSPTCEERQVDSTEEWGLLKTTAVTWDGWDHTRHKVPPKSFWNNHRIEIHNGDVLITKAGPRHRVGVCVYVDDTPSHIMASGKMIGIRPAKEKVNSVVLSAALATESTQRYLDQRTTGMADSQLNFTNDTLLETWIKLPPLPQQRKIAKILTTVDNQIEKTEELIAKYESVKQGMMQDLFTRGVDENGKLRPKRKDAPELYKKSELEWIPREWEVESINDLAHSAIDGPFGSLLKTEHYVDSPGVRVVRLQNLGNGEFLERHKAYISSSYAKKLRRYSVNHGDVLVASMGEDIHPVGRASIYTSKESGIVKADCFRIQMNPNIMTNLFACHALNSKTSRDQINKLGQGITRVRINLGNLKKVSLCIPSVSEQKIIIQKLTSIYNKITNEKHVKIKLQHIKTALMQDLLTGKVEVKPDPEDMKTRQDQL